MYKKMYMTVIFTAAVLAFVQSAEHVPAKNWQTARLVEIPAEKLTSENTEIHFDFDDVLIEQELQIKTYWSLITLAFTKNWKNSFSYIAALVCMCNRVDRDEYGNEYLKGTCSGVTYAVIYSAFIDPILQDYAADMINIMTKAHRFKKGVRELLVILRNKGYTIKIATNKDHLSCQDTLEAIRDKEISLYDYTTQAHVTYPAENEQIMQDMREYLQSHSTATDSFTQLIRRAFNAAETEYFKQANFAKPAVEYVQKQREYARKKYILFFDDHRENAFAVTGYGNGMIGMHITSDLSIAMYLHELGILSEEEYKYIVQILKR